MKINWHTFISSFVRRENVMIDDYITVTDEPGEITQGSGCWCVCVN